MLIIDSAKASSLKKRKEMDQQHERTNNWIKEQMSTHFYVQDDTCSVANIDRQLGTPMNQETLKKEIEKLNPNLRVEQHPFKPDKQVVYVLRNNQFAVFNPVTRIFERETKDRVLSCETFSPEYSMMYKKSENFPTLDRRVSKMRKLDIVWREAVRGWRTVLVGLVTNGLCSSEKADRLASRYSSINRESWQAHLGKSSRAKIPF